MIQGFFWVALGGALGSGCRYLVGEILQKAPNFPAGTFAVNLIGSFILGVLLASSLLEGEKNVGLKLFLTTGMMGGFTTYSTFSYESLNFMQKGQMGMAAFYIGATFILCLLASLAGYFCGRQFL